MLNILTSSASPSILGSPGPQFLAVVLGLIALVKFLTMLVDAKAKIWPKEKEPHETIIKTNPLNVAMVEKMVTKEDLEECVKPIHKDIDELKKRFQLEHDENNEENRNVHKRLNGITNMLGKVNGKQDVLEKTTEKILETLLHKKNT